MRANFDSIPTRKSLLLKLRSFDNIEGWQQFFDTYWSLIYSMAVRLGLSDAEAQDVVQETIICVAKSMPKFDYDPKKGSFKSWLRTVTRWRITDQMRRRRSAPIPLADLDERSTHSANEAEESDDSFGAVWNEEWRSAIIEAAAEKTKAKVDEKQFQIFDLCTLREWPAEKIATVLKISRARVYVSNHRVRKIFEQELKALDLETEL